MDKAEREIKRAERKANRKPFNESGLGKFLKGAGSLITDKIGGVLPDSGVLGIVKGLIHEDKDLSPENKEIALAMLQMDLSEMQEVTKRWESDMMSDSWLSKNVRPLVLIFLTFAMSIFIIIDSSINGFDVKEDWIGLLSSLLLLVYGAYFGGRSLEKIQKMRNNNN